MGTFVRSVVHKIKMVSEDGKNGKTRVKPRTTGCSGSFGFWRLVGRPQVGPPISLCVLQRPATREEVALCLTDGTFEGAPNTRDAKGEKILVMSFGTRLIKVIVTQCIAK